MASVHPGVKVTSKADAQRQFARACKQGDSDAVHLLLSLSGDYAIDTAALGPAALRDACSAGHVTVVRQLLALDGDRAINVHAGAGRVLLRACEGGHLAVVTELLGLQGDRCMLKHMCQGKQVRLAAGSGCLALVQLLLDAAPSGAPPLRSRVGGAFIAACGGGHCDIVDFLLRHEAGVDEASQRMGLELAVKARHVAVVHLCMQHPRSALDADSVTGAFRLAADVKRADEAMIGALLQCTHGAAAVHTDCLLQAYPPLVRGGKSHACARVLLELQRRSIDWDAIPPHVRDACWYCVRETAKSGLAGVLREDLVQAQGWPRVVVGRLPGFSAALPAGSRYVRGQPPSSARSFDRCAACCAMLRWLLYVNLTSRHSPTSAPGVATPAGHEGDSGALTLCQWLQAATRVCAWHGMASDGRDHDHAQGSRPARLGRRQMVLSRVSRRGG